MTFESDQVMDNKIDIFKTFHLCNLSTVNNVISVNSRWFHSAWMKFKRTLYMWHKVIRILPLELTSILNK